MSFINKLNLDRINLLRDEVTQKPALIETRLLAENKARTLLNNKSGSFDIEDFELFLNYCNTERVPTIRNPKVFSEKETFTRFGLSFNGKNRKRLMNSTNICNFWSSQLWNSDGHELSILEKFWQEKNNLGAGIGLPALILYLKEPLKYNIWLPSLHDSVTIITKKRLNSKRSSENYLFYNKLINSNLRHPFSLKPQEIDYILFWICKNAKE
jgi:hypothetical protein